ncbi:MAG: sigma-54-dependent Fis family transcriptional regulator [Proteobacteria bacterium]|nr:sigma-54-dependent Fis family transcriptional regulator [Pseudomonadota bacterium]
MACRVLFVDDDTALRTSTVQWLQLSGFDVAAAASAAAAFDIAAADPPDVIVSDVRMPGADGLSVLRHFAAADSTLPVILVTGHGDVPLAVEAMRLGAYDFLQKPFEPEHLVEVIRKADDKRRLMREVIRLRSLLGDDQSLASRLIGSSAQAAALRDKIAALASVDCDVIVMGETGAGKEVVARALHDLSRRASGPYVAINCAAIPADMFESELFGHEAGAFTGARGVRVGRLEYANGGTLLLDEIESMPMALQAKVLRAVQERQIERLGSNQSIPLDLRIVAATKDDLKAASEAGRFRKDLYYRLHVGEIVLPPLRERAEDIPLLFLHFANDAARRHGRELRPLDKDSIAALLEHDWPGNVRELRTAAERFAIGLETPAERLALPAVEAAEAWLPARLAAYERELIAAAIREHHGDMAGAAQSLGIPRRTLNEKMNRLGISRRGAAEQGTG